MLGGWASGQLGEGMGHPAGSNQYLLCVRHVGLTL